MSTIQLDSNGQKNAIKAYLNTLDLYTSKKNIVFKYDETDIKFDKDNPPTFRYNLPNRLEINGIESSGNQRINIKITLPLKLKLILELNKKLEEYRSAIKEFNIDNIDEEDYRQWAIRLGEIREQLNLLEMLKPNRTRDLNKNIILNDIVKSKLNNISTPNYLWYNYKLFNPYDNLNLTVRPGVFNVGEEYFNFDGNHKIEHAEVEIEQKEEFANYFIEGNDVLHIESKIDITITPIQDGGKKTQSINKNNLQKTVNSRLPEGWKAYYVPEKDSDKHAVLLHLNLFTEFESNKVFAQSILNQKDKYEDFYDVSDYTDDLIATYDINTDDILIQLPEYNYILLMYHEDNQDDVARHKNLYRRIIYENNPVFLDELDDKVYDEEHAIIGTYKRKNSEYIVTLT
jgi:hypothetical protein